MAASLSRPALKMHPFFVPYMHPASHLRLAFHRLCFFLIFQLGPTGFHHHSAYCYGACGIHTTAGFCTTVAGVARTDLNCGLGFHRVTY